MAEDVPPTTVPTLTVGLLAAAVGGGLGTLLRWALTTAWPAPATNGFPWTVLLVNVAGSAALAALPLLPAARARPWLTVLLGTGVCGGFTTMSTATVDGLGLLRDDRTWAAVGYLGGTLGGALVAVLAVAHVVGRARDQTVADEGGDL